MNVSKTSLVACLYYAYEGLKDDSPVICFAETLELQSGSREGEFKGNQESVQIELNSQQTHDSLIVQLTLSLPEGEQEQP